MEVRSESYPMVGGHGEYSYAKNSAPQKIRVEGSIDMLVAAISENLDLKNSSTSSSFSIADLGCSIGPTTFFVVKNIIEAVENKYKSENPSDNIPEFFVFFNDHVGNDFNALFNNLPLEKQYYAAGVPGSFHGRLFPNASLDFIYSSNAVHWFSKLPEELCVEISPAYNKGRIFYTNAPVEVCQAYFAQFAKDMDCFLGARAQEIIPGGLMALVIPGRLDGIAISQSSSGPFLALESCLLDLANEGKVSKDRIDKFNLPVYLPALEELIKIIAERNESFDIVKSETFQQKSSPQFSKQECRAASEGIITKHFGVEILEELYDRYEEKIADSPSICTREGAVISILLLLKRKYS